ncbi:hypothetical protein MMC14_008978 [Varicellaria rhodocarpa]|nr:hypothetical protein [Varicellaria rhodocarpa]
MPDDLRNLAAKVIQQCVTLQGGIGGFGTLGIANLLNYAAQGFTPYNVIGFPGSTIFLTVSVRERQTKTSDPGSTDPSIALALTQVALGASRLGNPYRGISASQVWAAQAAKMSRDSAQQTQTWYETSSSLTDQMNYECDAGLGSPSVVDCTQIEWNQLNPPSDTLAIDPGVTRFFHSNTCYLAISAAVSIVLTWAQIRTAVSTLMNACLRTPNHVAQGGRAHYSPPHQISRKKRVKRQTDLTGLNALPPSVNFTIFEQHETWINPITELKSCTWEAILRDSSVSACLAP